MVMTTDTIVPMTLNLPAGIVERIQQVAQRRRQSAESVVEELLNLSLSPSPDVFVSAWESLVEERRHLSVDELRRMMSATLTESDQKRPSRLLALNRERKLSSEEDAEIDALLYRNQEVAMERAAAIYLLQKAKAKRR